LILVDLTAYFFRELDQAEHTLRELILSPSGISVQKSVSPHGFQPVVALGQRRYRSSRQVGDRISYPLKTFCQRLAYGVDESLVPDSTHRGSGGHYIRY
jgi:hypothetical protein